MKKFITTDHKTNPPDSYKAAGATVTESRLNAGGAKYPRGTRKGSKTSKAMSHKGASGY